MKYDPLHDNYDDDLDDIFGEDEADLIPLIVAGDGGENLSSKPEEKKNPKWILPFVFRITQRIITDVYTEKQK